MEDNPLKKLEMLGQSIWLDYIRRDLIESGKLRRLIDEDGLRGITSNPAIFENLGEVILVRSSVVDIRFDAYLPSIYSILCAGVELLRI